MLPVSVAYRVLCCLVVLGLTSGCSSSGTAPSGTADTTQLLADVPVAGDTSTPRDAPSDDTVPDAPLPRVDATASDAVDAAADTGRSADIGVAPDDSQQPPDVADAGGEADVCTPVCEGFQCGDDGCGGSCGACADGLDCISNVCVSPPCIADCTDAECGDDGCGGSCGACAGGSSCVGITCVVDCVPECEGKVCGPDGCGGQCEPNICAIGFACANGQCTQDCSPSCGGKACGDNGCGGSCGTCADAETCIAGQCEGPCVPDCSEKECGGDGCGGTCGKCTLPGTFCSDAGQCDNLGGSSCVGHCGGPNPGWPCQCDAFCADAGNCCPDMCEVCGDLCP